jgi:CDP-diacylglycerol pyrophosphatase
MWRHALPALLLAVLLLAPLAACAADPSALWKIVHGQCVPHEEADRDPAPCSVVDIAMGQDKGFAVLKDIVGVAQFLLIPTERLSGIEDPAILAPGATNYWSAAWNARYFVEERVHTELPREAISLAINSAMGRTQNQLHIHIDCIRRDVHDALAGGLDEVGTQWAVFPVPLAGHSYRAIRINQQTLEGVDPFRVLADTDPRPDMAKHTLVAVGATFADGKLGFVLLDDEVNLATGNRGSGEELQDHSCAIAPKLAAGARRLGRLGP